MKPSEYAKAIVGALVAGLTALATAAGDGQINMGEGFAVAIAVVATFGGVFGVPNRPATPRRDPYGHVGGDPLVVGLLVAVTILLGAWLVVEVFHNR